MPEKALEWCDKALSKDPKNIEAHWQKALALLTMRQWEEGWKLYEYRQNLNSWDARKSIDAPLWNGDPVDHLYIHGEQGIGDEVMFASMLNQVQAKRVTVEVNPKLAPLIKLTWRDFNVVTEETRGDYDAKIPIGSLRHLLGGPSGAAYLLPDYDRIEFYRKALKKLGKGPYIALTWVGGTKATRVEDRTICLQELRPIMDAFTCVSGQYSDTNPMIEGERIAAGLHKIDDASPGLDLAEQAALFSAVDAVVTVQQTAVHVAGAVGAKTYAMIGSHPHWRYGVSGDKLPWYPLVRLVRQHNDWGDVVSRVLEALKTDIGGT
jgi:hypothetical protein